MKKWLGGLAASFLLIAAGYNLHNTVRDADAGVSCSVPFNLTNGTTADASQVMANYNAIIACLGNAAAAGANTDITALLGLTTPLSPTEGGSTVFIGATPTASGNTVVIASTTPGGFSYTTGYTVAFIAQAANPATATINVNAQGNVNLFKQSPSGATPLTGGELQAGQVVLATYDGTEFQINPVPNVTPGFGLSSNASQTAIQINTSQPPYGFDQPVNLGLSAIASGSLLNVSFVQANGQTPTATSPILIPFRDATGASVANGKPNWVSVIATTTINTNATGASLGTANNVPFRFWIVAFNNAGTVVPALINASTATTVFALDETSLQSSTGISAGATSAGTFYTPNGTTVTAKAFRIVGYLEYSAGLATVGTYGSNPTKLQLFGPGVKKPGEVVQSLYTQNGTFATASVSYTPSTTLPTTAQAVLGASQAIAPTSSANLLDIEGQVASVMSNATAAVTVFLYNGSAVVSAVTAPNNAAQAGATLRVNWRGLAASTSSQTFSVYGTASGTSADINSTAGVGQVFTTGTSNTYIHINEIMGALEPDHDKQPLRMTG